MTTAAALAPTVIAVKGRTTEQVLRDLITEGHNTDPFPTIAALVARFDAKAAKREAKSSGDTDTE